MAANRQQTRVGGWDDKPKPTQRAVHRLAQDQGENQTEARPYTIPTTSNSHFISPFSVAVNAFLIVALNIRKKGKTKEQGKTREKKGKQKGKEENIGKKDKNGEKGETGRKREKRKKKKKKG